jgi:hypothetical protein
MTERDWRDSRPISEDERLQAVSPLVTLYRNKMIDADFNDDDRYHHYKEMYEHYLRLEKSGIFYEPKF